MNMRWGVALLAGVLSVPFAGGQVRGTIGAGQGFNIGFVPPRHSQAFIPGNALLSAPYFYPDYGPGLLATQTQQPQVVVVQIPAAPAETVDPPKVEGLMIEWQGDHYARTSGQDDSAKRSKSVSPDYSERATGSRGPAQVPADAGLPVVLVFRDGRQQSVNSYTIVGATLYAAADPWKGSSWTTKIFLNDLDLADTVRLNQARGVRFVVPAGPGEVVASF